MSQAQPVQQIPLPEFEINILNKVIPTRTFGIYEELKLALHQHVDSQKEELIRSGEIAANEYSYHKTHVVNNMIDFLVRNGFYGIREGNVYFMTEKGKQLQKQKSLQKYVEWKMEADSNAVAEMHTIERQGFLEKDQTYKKEREERTPIVEDDTKKNFGMYVIILIVLIIIAAIGKSNKWW